jgi:hypothetical protein
VPVAFVVNLGEHVFRDCIRGKRCFVAVLVLYFVHSRVQDSDDEPECCFQGVLGRDILEPICNQFAEFREIDWERL